MDTKSSVAIWVRSCQLYDETKAWKLHGIALDGAWGFDYKSVGDYSGLVALISLESKFIQSVHIAIYHSHRRGFGWFLETEKIPEPPFLITDILDTRIIHNGLIELKPTQDTIEEFEFSGEGVSYPVKGEGWLGILSLLADNKIHLLAFSNKDDDQLQENTEVVSTENDWCLGKLLQPVPISS